MRASSGTQIKIGHKILGIIEAPKVAKMPVPMSSRKRGFVSF